MGYFISIEGVEGVGKSTCIDFIREYLQRHAISVVFTREPGGTEIAEHIRAILLNHYDETMAVDTECLLMFASRAQHVAAKIKPALANHQWVVSDRFVDASFAYQGAGRGIPPARLQALSDWVLGDFKPDLTILLDAPLELALSRAKSRGEPDRIESEAPVFFEKIRQAYLERANAEPARFRLVDASCSIDNVKKQLAVILDEWILRSTQSERSV